MSLSTNQNKTRDEIVWKKVCFQLVLCTCGKYKIIEECIVKKKMKNS